MIDHDGRAVAHGRLERSPMFKTIPTNPTALIHWTWPEIEPLYKDLEFRPLDATTVDRWLADWSQLGELVEEMHARLTVATSINTADKEAEALLNQFLDSIFPSSMAAEQELKKKLLESRLEPQRFEIPLRNMRGNRPVP